MHQQINQISILLGFIVLVIAGLVWFGGSGTKTPAIIDGAYAGTLIAKESKYDFGTVSMAKGLVSKEFTLENQSKDSVKIGEVSTSCMCTEAELKVGDKTAGPFGMPGHGGAPKANLIVKPGEKLVVKTIFDPAAHGPAGVGPIERQVMISTGAASPMVLEFKAIVEP
ncbi:hypothetical protein A2833_01990 [Candidatus Azambacteria bacterium RIFCSPHIGHO2_01_FULL_44_55]|uniref:DUF1573 domain-containing protein n=1 Tax=Candidatus Azambacteria bacterium RIFCSPLOWO2_02_FULL_44_14 TaxID=1797306 RepID=A0A1F5CAS1_9BACT|nr:MAG: hypothetical protein A3A18_01105 [Candidatus Azambacteria bacterium RIFCSPLOWO2_01_FULL_44_84]OGD33459.1 MAG: hypothetical protein A3C78_00020 [Candidatus Azambacteria bacterium RIFCSPHIGHO2_02_FULL_45_18]OGD39686.1 MAG: hypothetical protein A2833_01990 [Candidatus Azambacteria bacterium RIFCSPHIGHO2_01_FULL_44_55]OGD39976.1 MAG: hypothetical protein A3I30_02105 [Candidatus Azambacteria bacterium RIFCSPLOWO2_02_FULL_44_14]OGD49669.1 MAG: hypothetical protein A2608_02960 [Candidatus Azam